MIGLDTNVIVRFLVQDDPAQSRRASRFMSKLSPEAPGYLTHVVLAETYWVLTRAYKLPPSEVLTALVEVVGSEDIVCQDAASVLRALTSVSNGAAFPDALIAEACRSAGCSSVVSFDRRAGRLIGFTSP